MIIGLSVAGPFLMVALIVMVARLATNRELRVEQSGTRPVAIYKIPDISATPREGEYYGLMAVIAPADSSETLRMFPGDKLPSNTGEGATFFATGKGMGIAVPVYSADNLHRRAYTQLFIFKDKKAPFATEEQCTIDLSEASPGENRVVVALGIFSDTPEGSVFRRYATEKSKASFVMPSSHGR